MLISVKGVGDPLSGFGSADVGCHQGRASCSDEVVFSSVGVSWWRFTFRAVVP